MIPPCTTPSYPWYCGPGVNSARTPNSLPRHARSRTRPILRGFQLAIEGLQRGAHFLVPPHRLARTVGVAIEFGIPHQPAEIGLLALQRTDPGHELVHIRRRRAPRALGAAGAGPIRRGGGLGRPRRLIGLGGVKTARWRARIGVHGEALAIRVIRAGESAERTVGEDQEPACEMLQ